MELIDAFNRAGLFAKMGMLIAFAPLVASLLYAVKPSERRLALVRPLSLAAIFAGLASFMAGVIAVLTGISAPGDVAGTWRTMVFGAAETVAALFIAFSSLAISWLLVALGIRRTA